MIIYGSDGGHGGTVIIIFLLYVRRFFLFGGLHVENENEDDSIASILYFGLFANKNSSIVYHDLMGSFLFMSFDGSVCFLSFTTMN